MTNKNKFMRGILSGSTALSALAVVGGFAASAVVATPALAQDYTTGVIVGSVRGPDGNAPVTSGTVTVVSNDQGFTRNTTIASDGSFRVPSLPTGTYTVTISAPGFQSVADPSVAVAAGTSNTFVSTMGAGGQATSTADAAGGTGSEIVVIGRAVRANDFAQTTTGLLVDVDELTQTVPVGRSQTALILLAPGTTAGDTGFGNLAAIGGATVAENSYYVNGLNTTDFRNFLGSSIVPFEFYESLDVQTGGYQAEFGRALGGFVNATTERGTNDFRGGAVLVYNPDAFGSNAPNTYAAFNENDYSESGDATLFLSGPLIRDRLFFYGFYNPRFLRNEDTSILSQQRIISTSKPGTAFWGGKVDAILFEGHRLEGTIFSDKQTQRTDYYTTSGDISGTLTGEVNGVGGDQDFQLNGGNLGRQINGFGGLNYIGTYTGAFTDWFTLSASYGKNKNRGTQTVSPNVPSVVSQLTGANTQASGSVAAFVGDRDTREIYRVDADVYVNNLFGDHHFRAGYDVENLEAIEDTRRTGVVADGDIACSFVLQANRPYKSCYSNQGTFSTKMSSFYLQDSWKLFNERLVLNLGIRNDSFENRTVAGISEEQASEQNAIYYESKNNWGPRLGATFDVFGDRRTKLQAFWGRYFLPVATNTNIRLGGAELFYTQRLEYAPGTKPASGFAANPGSFNSIGLPNVFPVDANGTPLFTDTTAVFSTDVPCPELSPDAGENCRTVSSDGQLGTTDTLIQSGLNPSYSDEMILGLTHRFGDWTAGIQYINRRLGETLDDVAIDAAVNAYCEKEGIVGCEDAFTGFHQYVLANPGSDITVRLDGDCEVDERQCEFATLDSEDLGYPRAVRKYDSVQFTMNRRWDDVWSFNGSYTWTKLRGNYEGAVTTDQNQSDAGLTQDFDQPGFLEGRFGSLPNERRHSFKMYGAVQATPWLRVGVNALLQSPRKFSCFGNYLPEDGGTSFEAQYGAASQYCQQSRFKGNPERVATAGGFIPVGSTVYLVPRGTAFESDWEKRVDLRLAMAIPGLENSEFAVDVFNLFNFRSKLDFQEFGDIGFAGPNPRYGQVTGYQAPRSVRFTLGMRFGPGFGGSSESRGEESVTQGR